MAAQCQQWKLQCHENKINFFYIDCCFIEIKWKQDKIFKNIWNIQDIIWEIIKIEYDDERMG